ncbi:MAG: hypothetical protein PUP92_28810 [Rhizonema sp. PD38]|nr:hypothetical protein [Rhizonema sp. PD38]
MPQFLEMMANLPPARSPFTEDGRSRLTTSERSLLFSRKRHPFKFYQPQK